MFFVALFIVALGAIQLLSTFYTYAVDLSELNGLKRQEAALEAKQQELENDIARWSDKAYVAAQARERLGFVFPGEQVVRVLHPEAVTGGSEAEGGSEPSEADSKALPWYSELAYSLEQADRKDQSASDSTDSTAGQSDGSADGQTDGQSDGQSGDDGQSDAGQSGDPNTNTEEPQQ